MSFGDRTEPCCTRTGLVQTLTVRLGGSFGGESQVGQASLESIEESRLGVDVLEDDFQIRCKVLQGDDVEGLWNQSIGDIWTGWKKRLVAPIT